MYLRLLALFLKSPTVIVPPASGSITILKCNIGTKYRSSNEMLSNNSLLTVPIKPLSAARSKKYEKAII